MNIDSAPLSPATSRTASVHSAKEAAPKVDIVALPTPGMDVVLSDEKRSSDSQADAVEGDAVILKRKRGALEPFKGHSLHFWLVFVGICISCVLSALDLTAVSTIIPTMAADLDSDQYTWIANAYALSSTAMIPWCGGLSSIFGRKWTIVGSLVFFAAGSAIVASAHNMTAAIAGRAVQGVGGGGILILTDIIIIDLIPLADRGPFFGIAAATWSCASAIGPPIGGAFASSGNWRWLFWLNLPICALDIAVILLFFKIKAPDTTWQEKWAQMDFANIIFIAAATVTIIGLTWGGVQYSWGSAQVLAPIILGLAGMVLFLWIEKRFVKHPTVPFSIMTDRTAVAGLTTNFLHGIVSFAVMYFVPVAFQSLKGDTAAQSGVDSLSLSFSISPLAALTGISVTATGHYLGQNVIGWIVLIVGFALLSLLNIGSSNAVWIVYCIITGVGVGILYPALTFPVLAPLKPEEQPASMAWFGFVRCLGQVFGIAVGSTVVSNELGKHLPTSFLEEYGSAAETVIPYIRNLAEPLQTEVRNAFAKSLQMLWYVSLGISVASLVITFAMKSLPLTAETDEKWGMEDKVKAKVEAVKEKVKHDRGVEV